MSPAFVATAMSRIRKPSLFAPDPVHFARKAVATIGIKESTNAYLPHVIQVYEVFSFVSIPQSYFIGIIN